MMTKQQIAALMEDPLLSPKEAAIYLGVCTDTVVYHCQKGNLAHARLGYRTYRIRRSALDKFLAERSKPKTSNQQVHNRKTNVQEAHGSTSVHVRVRPQAAEQGCDAGLQTEVLQHGLPVEGQAPSHSDEKGATEEKRPLPLMRSTG
jgi:excisionase family DNA binding protein